MDDGGVSRDWDAIAVSPTPGRVSDEDPLPSVSNMENGECFDSAPPDNPVLSGCWERKHTSVMDEGLEAGRFRMNPHCNTPPLPSACKSEGSRGLM